MMTAPSSRSDTCSLATRRELLVGLAGAVTLLAADSVGAQSDAPHDIIDVHAHFMPPSMQAAGSASPVMRAWSVQRHLEAMQAAGVGRSILSITTPGVVQPGDTGRALIRECNEFGARLVSDHPHAFGQFVYVRLDDTDNALSEIAHGLDTLKAHGVGLFTSYDNKWLGDPQFDPVFDELNRRHAIVYVHPTTSPCCRNLIPDLADTMVELGTDTTRAIASYLYRGRAQRYPNIRLIWSHSGGTMPYLIERFEFADRNGPLKNTLPGGFRASAGRFFYDVAQASNTVATRALRAVIPPTHILFGTDYPFRTPAEHVAQLQAGGVFNRTELADLYRGNIMRDMPGLLG